MCASWLSWQTCVEPIIETLGETMRSNCKLCWSITGVILLLSFGIGAFLFVGGRTVESDEDRTAILLNSKERAFVLAEMRGLLEAVEAITQGIAENDMVAVSEAARAVGTGAAGGEPVTLIAKLPLSFKSLGMATHQAFDDLGVEAEDMGDGTVLLQQLSAILTNCTSCHAGYRFALEEGGGS